MNVCLHLFGHEYFLNVKFHVSITSMFKFENYTIEQSKVHIAIAILVYFNVPFAM